MSAALLFPVSKPNAGEDGFVVLREHHQRLFHFPWKGGMLYVGGYPTIPSEKYIPDASLGITSDGFFDLEEQPKRVAVVGPVELARACNNRLSKLPHKQGVWRIFPAAIPLLSLRVEQVLGGHLLHIQSPSQAYRE
ncbi:MAG: hypothetical protein NXY57DRAFT_1103886 [Lentinula lateritia]|nr:MAG: hypothetical protein NXY57DRAFT_1103886 [Lentinula lateritia]